MAGWRRVIELTMTDEEIERLTVLSRSRTEAASRVSRAQMLLAYRENPSFCAVGQRVGVHHQTVQRCVERALAYGPLAAIEDRPRPGKEPVITPEAKAWLVSLACDKAKEHGFPHELWTTRLLARHARQHGPASGHECLAKLVQGTVCKILGQEEIKPHKVRYYLERRDAEFEHHLFRTAGASTAAVYGGNHPHLASALLNHRDPRITEEHYNRATTFSAGDEYALITQFYREHKSGD